MDKKWYALYTKARAEMKAELELNSVGIETYLPRQKILRVRQGKKRYITEPLIRSYIFVYIDKKQVLQVNYIPGISGFVKLENLPAIIPDSQINSLKILLGSDDEFETFNETFLVGDQVEILYGQLSGLKGKLIQYNGKNKVVLYIDALHVGFMVDVPIKYLLKLAA